MEQRLTQIGLTRLGLVTGSDRSTLISPERLAAYEAELANLGVRISNPDEITVGMYGSFPQLRDVFELNGKGGVSVPFVYDIAARKVIYFDGYISSGWGARTERSASTIGGLGRVLVNRKKIVPSVTQLAGLHALSRGARLVPMPYDATITFGVDDDCTYNALRPQKLLADLL